MSERPVLDTIRALLRFKDHTTIAEIAKISGLKARHVLDVVNRNGEFVYRLRKNGNITKVDVHTRLHKQLWESGRYYRPDTFGMFSVEGHCLKFEGHTDLRNQLQERRIIGALGDNTETNIIADTPENRAAIEAHGLTMWRDDLVDDRLWVEEVAGA